MRRSQPRVKMAREVQLGNAHLQAWMAVVSGDRMGIPYACKDELDCLWCNRDGLRLLCDSDIACVDKPGEHERDEPPLAEVVLGAVGECWRIFEFE